MVDSFEIRYMKRCVYVCVLHACTFFFFGYRKNIHKVRENGI